MKKNVLQLIPSFHQGGSERQALQLAQLLVDEGSCEIQLACLDKNGSLKEEEIGSRFEQVADFPLTSFYDANMARQLRRFVGYLKKNRINIVQTHDFYTNIFGMIGARIAGVSVRIAAKRETGMRTVLQRFVERRAFGTASSVVVNSERVKRYLAGTGVPATKLEVVHNGIDHARFTGIPPDRNATLKDLGLPADGSFRFVTIVANLRDPVKNHEMFLRAARRVAVEIPDAGFVIAGEGERSRLITSMSQDLGLAERTYLLGRCSRVPELLAVSDVCVLTSDSEGFSNSILEYMAAGKPVVATDVGGASEAVIEGETGFLVSANDDKALAERICRLLKDRALATRLGRAGRRLVGERFSAAAQLERTLAIYERELARSRGT